MRPRKVVLRTFIRQPLEIVYRWHLRRNALLRGFPGWEKWRYISEQELAGHQIRVTQKLQHMGFWWFKVIMRIQFDHQRFLLRVTEESKLFKMFSLNIEFRPHSGDACEIVERMEFIAKWPFFFRSAREKIIEKKVRVFFNFHHEAIIKDLEFAEQYGQEQYGNGKKKKILISGANGMIGRFLEAFLESLGHEVHQLTRFRSKREKTVFFDDKTGEVDLKKLEGFDAVIHLRGKNVLGRWTQRMKNEMTRSRVNSTKKLCHHLAALSSPPKVFLCASALGYYGDRGSELLDEKSERGSGSFLSELTKNWEDASKNLIRKDIRVVHLRFGLVLGMQGGALARFMWPIRLGLAGCLGDGKQYQSWISIDDAASAITHCMLRNDIAGAVNIVAPNPVKNIELSRAVADHFGKPLGPKVPPRLVRLFAGNMGDELMLSSTRCHSNVLKETKFRFRYSTIKEALKHLLPPK